VDGRRVLIVDDLLATGGTGEAAGKLVRELGGTVAGYAFFIELTDHNGRRRLGGNPVTALVQL
jgi:adenine phosphoribosyltransferase